MSARLGVFLGGAALALWLSRGALAHPAAHGFPRFFGWVAILGLLARNVGSGWFADAGSPRQLASWALLVASLVPVVLGVRQLLAFGRPDAARRRDPRQFDFEQTTQLVTSGIYRWIRHPLYASLVYLAWGVFLKRPDLPAAALALAGTAGMIATMLVEERENAAYFGPAYGRYAAATWRMVPFVF